MSHELFWDALAGTIGLTITVWLASALARRSSAALRHTLWRTALAGFWLVPAILVVVNILGLGSHTVRVPVLPAIRVSQPSQPAGVQVSSPLAPSSRSSPMMSPLQTRPQAATTGGMGWGRLLFILWATGAALGGAYLLRDVYAVRRLLHKRSPVDDPVIAERVAGWTAKVGLEKMPALAESETVVVPTVAGWRAPVVLLPSRFSPNDAGADAVIVHELAHIQRGDVAPCGWHD